MAKLDSTFNLSEKKIIEMGKNAEFTYDNSRYLVLTIGKPTCKKGEPKTDIYILAKNLNNSSEHEFKVSFKQKNADFLENKIKKERAIQIIGKDWQSIIIKSTTSLISRFNERKLIYKVYGAHTQANSVTLGWRFELMNKPTGKLSDVLKLSTAQKLDVYRGDKLVDSKKNAIVDGIIIPNSGVCDYISTLDYNDLNTFDDFISSIETLDTNSKYINDFDIFYACKAVNYRFDEHKYERARDLSVYVDWKVTNDRLAPELVFDNPLEKNSNDIANQLLSSMKELGLKDTTDIYKHNIIDYYKSVHE